MSGRSWHGESVTIGARRDERRQWRISVSASSEQAERAAELVLRQELGEQHGDVAGLSLRTAQDDAAAWIRRRMPGADVSIVRE